MKSDPNTAGTLLLAQGRSHGEQGARRLPRMNSLIRFNLKTRYTMRVEGIARRQ